MWALENPKSRSAQNWVLVPHFLVHLDRLQSLVWHKLLLIISWWIASNKTHERSNEQQRLHLLLGKIKQIVDLNQYGFIMLETVPVLFFSDNFPCVSSPGVFFSTSFIIPSLIIVHHCLWKNIKYICGNSPTNGS